MKEREIKLEKREKEEEIFQTVLYSEVKVRKKQEKDQVQFHSIQFSPFCLSLSLPFSFFIHRKEERKREEERRDFSLP